MGDDPRHVAAESEPRFEVLRLLGEGAMGRVLLARDHELGRLVALKTLHERLDSNEKLLRRLLREARACARLRHPHVVRVYDVISFRGRDAVVFEYVEGQSLDGVLAQGLLRGEALELLAQVAEGLAHAHGLGLVHRDLKPANVLVTGEGQAKVGDWGLVSIRSDVLRLTATGMLLGTPAYMAPEQIRGEEAGAAADFFALGIMLHEVLLGRRPFEGEDLAALLRMRLAGDAPSLHACPGGAGGPAATLITALLHEDPLQRLASGPEVARRIRGLAPALETGDELSQTKNLVPSSSEPPIGADPARTRVPGGPAESASLPERSVPSGDEEPQPSLESRTWMIKGGGLLLVLLGLLAWMIFGGRPRPSLSGLELHVVAGIFDCRILWKGSPGSSPVAAILERGNRRRIWSGRLDGSSPGRGLLVEGLRPEQTYLLRVEAGAEVVERPFETLAVRLTVLPRIVAHGGVVAMDFRPEPPLAVELRMTSGSRSWKELLPSTGWRGRLSPIDFLPGRPIAWSLHAEGKELSSGKASGSLARLAVPVSPSFPEAGERGSSIGALRWASKELLFGTRSGLFMGWVLPDLELAWAFSPFPPAGSDVFDDRRGESVVGDCLPMKDGRFFWTAARGRMSRLGVIDPRLRAEAWQGREGDAGRLLSDPEWSRPRWDGEWTMELPSDWHPRAAVLGEKDESVYLLVRDLAGGGYLFVAVDMIRRRIGWSKPCRPTAPATVGPSSAPIRLKNRLFALLARKQGRDQPERHELLCASTVPEEGGTAKPLLSFASRNDGHRGLLTPDGLLVGLEGKRAWFLGGGESKPQWRTIGCLDQQGHEGFSLTGNVLFRKGRAHVMCLRPMADESGFSAVTGSLSYTYAVVEVELQGIRDRLLGARLRFPSRVRAAHVRQILPTARGFVGFTRNRIFSYDLQLDSFVDLAFDRYDLMELILEQGGNLVVASEKQGTFILPAILLEQGRAY